MALVITREIDCARAAALIARQRLRSTWRAKVALPARQARGAEEAIIRSVRARGAVDTECANVTLALAAWAGSTLGVSHGAIVAGLAGGAFAANIELRVLFTFVADIEIVVAA